jgi:hypothetical protein
MKRLLALTTLLAAITVPLAAAGSTTPATDGTLSVKRGRGAIMLKLKGTVIGQVAKNGRVQIRDFKPFDDNDPQLSCKPKPRHPSFAVSICTGRNIRFRVDDGRFNIQVRGTGISISAVGYGKVDVDGAGDTGVSDGVIAIDDQPYESLPDELTTYLVGTPPTRP